MRSLPLSILAPLRLAPLRLAPFRLAAFTLALIPLPLSACAFEVVHGNGNVREEERVVPAFTHVSIEANLVTEVIPTGEPGVTLKADENLLGHLAVRVDGGKLVIAVDEPGVALEPSQPMTALITTDTLAELSVTGDGEAQLAGFSGDRLGVVADGAGEVRILDADVNTLDASHGGSGLLRLEGAAERLELKHGGEAEVVAVDLAIDRASLRLSGAGDVSITTDGVVEGKLFGSGDLIIHGTPSRVDVDDHGSGGVSIRN